MKIIRAISISVSIAVFSVCSGITHADDSFNSPVSTTTQIIQRASSSEGIDTSLNLGLTTANKEVITLEEARSIKISHEDGQAKIENTLSSLIINDSAGQTLETDGYKTAIVDSASSNNVDYAITVASAGNVRVHSIIGNQNAPERFSYSFPEADSIVIDSDSGVAFLFAFIQGKPKLIGGIDSPWARDANGLEVPTHFEAQGNTLIQVVEHKLGNFSYPITADPSWWDDVKGWFKNAGSWIASKAESAANWLGPKAKWLGNKTWSGTKWVAGKGKIIAKKVGPGAVVLCAVGGGWAWYRSNASGWIRVGDAVAGCFL